MDYKIKKLEKSMVQINLTLSKAEWDKEVEDAYNKNKGKFKVEGFRQGKAPRRVIEKMYGENVFYEEALSEGFYKAYMQILSKEKDLEPVDAPNLTVKSMGANGIELEAQVVTKPEVKVNKYKGFGVEVEAKKVSKKDVDAELEKARQQHARMVEVEREVKVGDVANINFSGSIDGVKFEGGTGENYDLEIGSHSFIEGFEDQLVGLKAGEDKDVDVTFPADYHATELAGKPAVFACHINAVKEKQLPELNDEFASNVSEYETLEEYRKETEEHLQHHLDEHAKVDAENKIMDLILENTTVDIPEVMVENELNEIMRDMEYRLMYQGLTLDAYCNYMKTTVEELKESRRESAVKSVKIRLALSYILEKEKLTIEDKEVDEKIAEMAKHSTKSLKEFKANLPEERINYIKNEILMSKLLAFLLENNSKKSK